MKIGKDALRHSRQLLRSCLNKEGGVDVEKAQKVVDLVGKQKPRNYLPILAAFQRLLRLELEKRQALVSSATELEESVRADLEKNLQKRYGKDLSIDYEIDPGLIGGTRVRVGSDVWDGTVKERLHVLEQALA